MIFIALSYKPWMFCDCDAVPTRLFITHLHGDHLYGLPGLLCTLGNGLDPARAALTTVHVTGPLGVRRFLQTVLGLSRSPLPYRLAVTELVPRPDQLPPDWAEWRVEQEAGPEPHPAEAEYTRLDLTP